MNNQVQSENLRSSDPPPQSTSTHEILYLGEIKRFITYYSTCLYYQKAISEEAKLMKDKLNTIYQDLVLVSRHQPSDHAAENPHIVQLFNTIIAYIRDQNQQILSSIWKASIKTLIKLLSFPEVVTNLTQRLSNEGESHDTALTLNPNFLIQVFLEAPIDPVDQSEEEQKLLLKQKVLIKVAKTFPLTEAAMTTVFKYILQNVKKGTLEDIDQYYSMQFGDQVKKNLHKFLNHLMENEDKVKDQIIRRLMKKGMKNIQLLKSLSAENKKGQSNLKLKEYICYLIKTLEDCLKKLELETELTEMISTLRVPLIEIICVSSEFDDIMIRNQSQQLFSFLLTAILDNKMPLREELEVLLVKVVLKPALTLAKKLLSSSDIKFSKKSSSSTSSQALIGGSASGTGQPPEFKRSGSFQGTSIGSSQATLNDSDYENEDFIQVHHERSIQEDILLEMNMNYLQETLMTLKPEQLAQLFLLYDCQPFSENFITKAILMLLKFSSQRPDLYFRLYHCFVQLFKAYSQAFLVNQHQKSAPASTTGPQMISFMLEQKAQTRKFARDLNAKFKTFLAKVDDLYSYMDEGTPAEVASKILIYSRDVEINKVIEVIGGKDDRAKRIIEAFLDKIDFTDGHIENAMRRFLQTFRLAGVDSQVVSRIIERFSHKFHDKDPKQLFKTKDEVNDFAYLIIVLQTSQHNPSMKSKIDLRSFKEQALINMPETKDILPENYLEDIFNSVTKTSFYTPISRSLIDEGYNIYNMTEVQLRLWKSKSEVITESEFINTADLTNKQLFHYSNSLQVPPTLIPLAAKHLLSFLTIRFIKQILNSPFQQHHYAKTIFDLTQELIKLNKDFHSNDLIDKLFQLLYFVVTTHKYPEQARDQTVLEQLLWDNFDCLKRSLILLPKLSLSTFMKDEVKLSLKAAFISVKTLTLNQHQARRKSEIQQQADGQNLKGGHGQQQPQKAPSFFDLFYNYFTENADQEDAREKIRKEEAHQLKTLEEMRKRVLMEDKHKEEDYQETLEETFDDKIRQQWQKEKTRLHELITLICTQIRENLNQEEGTLCLAFLDHIIRKAADHGLETLEKLWIEMHLLVANCIKQTKDRDAKVQFESGSGVTGTGPSSNSSKDYEVVSSSDTSQDSMDHQNILSSDLIIDVFSRDSCAIKTKLYEQVNRHLILQLHLALSKELLIKKHHEGNTHHIVREVQKIVSNVIEEENEQTFEEAYLFENLQKYFEGMAQPLKAYPKISKLVRLMLILLLKSYSKKFETSDSDKDKDDTSQTLSNIQKQLLFFRTITQLQVDLNAVLPSDLIGLTLDVFSKVQLPQNVSEKTPKIQNIIESALQIIDNLTCNLQKSATLDDETKQDFWFRMIRLLQDKVLLTSSAHVFNQLTLQSFNVIKNAVLMHPFEIDKPTFQIVKKLFSEILFQQTFDKLVRISEGLEALQNNPHPSEERKEEEKEKEVGKDNDSDSSESNMDSLYRLEQMSNIAVNNLSDIFIYYISSIFKDGLTVVQGEQDASYQLFTYLWLNLLKVLLNYAEQANAKEMHNLVICAHDNIKRVIEFLIQQEILTNSQHAPADMTKLWKTSWDSIGAFFTEMKVSVLGGPREEISQPITPQEPAKDTITQEEQQKAPITNPESSSAGIQSV